MLVAFFNPHALVARLCKGEVPIPYSLHLGHLGRAAIPHSDKIVPVAKTLMRVSA
ncbi:MAG: hypothetical protein ACI9IV_001859 [Paracoccaceae bacterium]|jgi:hypothetical protein|tara:strand:+ start:232 stop:396 length:165 start_codon:yes stop_codon:yes gene_type:complete